MSKVDGFAHSFLNFLNLVFVENGLQFQQLVLSCERLGTRASTLNRGPILNCCKSALIEIDLVVNPLTEVVTFVGFEDHRKMTPVPVVTSWYKPQYQCIEIVLSQFLGFIHTSSKVFLLISEIKFTLWHIEE